MFKVLRRYTQTRAQVLLDMSIYSTFTSLVVRDLSLVVSRMK